MIYKPTFLHQNRPLNTCMIQTDRADIARNLSRDAAFDGCDAYGFQMECFDKNSRTEDVIRGIFSFMDGKPIYVTNYRYQQNAGMTDDELSEGLFFLRRCGATLLDVMGDYYCPTPGELTMDPDAIAKQKDLIARIHDAGGEVLMSSHILKFTPAEEVLRIAKEHETRGADIAKIVTAANTEEEELENLRITTLLRRELNIPFLFLSGGSHCQLHRTIGPMLGCCMWLTVHEQTNTATKSQPSTRAIRAIADNFSYTHP